jgi:hypothetical protein
MNEPKRTFEEKAKAISGGVAALAGILAAVSQYNASLKALVDSLGPIAQFPAIVWFLIAAILLIMGVFVLRDGLTRRSCLMHPEALSLKTDEPRHLKGREEDLDRLSTHCNEYQQVYLVGESGAGKSALIQAGLCPALKADRGLFPIYLNIWGEDWQKGPRFALIQELGETFSEEERRALGLTAPPEPEDLVSILEQFRAKLGRTPLLIFDQFDDYQTRHRSQFLAGRRRTWLSASRLIEANAFWLDIKQLIDNHAVHCLFATRTDAADGLESVRFVEPRVYPLDRLHAASVLPLLTDLTTNAENPIVFAPDRGWERLKGRLARDLSQDGAVLPVQMKIVLQGLASLGSLTVRDYERVGGLHGLEAAHIEWHVASTALHSGLTRVQVRTLLMSLADAETLKTVPRSTADLEKAIIAGDETNTGRFEKAVEAALNDLQMKEIIRKRLDPDTRQHVWSLDHDYLSRGVLEAERRANHWFASVQEGYGAFQDAGSSMWRKWRALLSPWQQMVLVSHRLRGRFRYSTLRSYAGWSLCRFVPYFLVLAAVSFGGFEVVRQQQASHDRLEAKEIRDAIGFYEALSPTEKDHLWKLANSSDAVRDSFFKQALESSTTAEQFNRRADVAIQAAVGLNPDTRERVFRDHVLPCLRHPPKEHSKKMACSVIGIELAKEDENAQFPTFALNTLILAIEKTTDRRQLEPLAGALKAVAEKLPAVEAAKIFAQLTASIEKTTNPYQRAALAGAVKAVAEKLPAAEAAKIFAQLTASIEKATNPWELELLAGALKAVPGELPAAEAAKIFAQLTASIEKTTAPRQLAALAGVLKAVPGKLDRQELINLLKSPLSVGALRSTLLHMLEQQMGQQFDGNLWKAVIWSQQNGLDVKSPPKRSNK